VRSKFSAGFNKTAGLVGKAISALGGKTNVALTTGGAVMEGIGYNQKMKAARNRSMLNVAPTYQP
jgi:hypothetical protein